MNAAAIIPPGGVIGIVGGGQLGRMTALAAAELGYACHIYCPDPDSPAFLVSAAHTAAAYDDAPALDRFAAAVDVVTFEFENVPHDTVRRLAERVPVRPGWECLHVSQDRLREKDFLNGHGIVTARYQRVESAAGLTEALSEFGGAGVLKTVTMGYDGKGQAMLRGGADPDAAWEALARPVGILEELVDFEREISVIVARGLDGVMRCFDPVENRHQNHILARTIAPAAVSPELAAQARDIAERTARALDLVGLLAVEMFVTKDGRVLVNEIAPRPHNSGHWTTDACVTGQFEQFVRAVCGLPLGDPARHSNAVMDNLIGDDADTWPAIVAEPGAKLHLYGKREARPGRKMGHVTRLSPKT